MENSHQFYYVNLFKMDLTKKKFTKKIEITLKFALEIRLKSIRSKKRLALKLDLKNTL